MNPTRVLVSAALAAVLSGSLASGALAAGTPKQIAVTFSGVQEVGSQVSAVAVVSPVPADPVEPRQVHVTSGSVPVEADVRPVLSDTTSLSLVVDASAQAAEYSINGGLSGIASFLLQAPPNATMSVVADQTPPVVLAPPAAGVTSALDAVTNLRNGGTRDTAAAIALALMQQRQPSQQSTLVVYTSGPDAGSMPAGQLIARLRATHTVLGVVTTSAEDHYWTQVAQSTGGLVVRTTPAEALHAFDVLSDGLTSRTVLTFPRPAGSAPVSVRVKTGDGVGTGTLTLPAAATTAPATSGTGSSSGGGLPLWVSIVIAALVALLVVAGLLFWRRRPVSRPPDAAESPSPSAGPPFLEEQIVDDDGSPLSRPGVRVFDLTDDGRPREITGSLFEPRAERDAREQRASDHDHEDAARRPGKAKRR